MVETEGISDRDRDLADTYGTRIRERSAGQRRSLEPDSEDCQVGVGIAANQIGSTAPSIGHHGRERFRLSDHVMVREDEAVRTEDDPGAAPAV